MHGDAIARKGQVGIVLFAFHIQDGAGDEQRHGGAHQRDTADGADTTQLASAGRVGNAQVGQGEYGSANAKTATAGNQQVAARFHLRVELEVNLHRSGRCRCCVPLVV